MSLGPAFLPLTTRDHHLPSSIPQTPHTRHLLHPQLFPIVMDYLYNTLPLLCLAYYFIVAAV